MLLIPSKSKYWLYFYGFKLGLKLLRRGHFRYAIPLLIIPVNYWRTIEYDVVARNGDFNSDDRVLDIGSPKLLSLFLADVVGAVVFATDIDEYFLRKFSLIRQIQGIPEERYPVSTEDGRKLTFPDNYFSKIFSISVIEHIPNDGDSECMGEISRVLAPGGKCMITVPFSERSGIEYQTKPFYWANSSERREDGKIFFQRRYSEKDIFERIINPSKLQLVGLYYFGEKILGNSQKEISNYLPKISGPIQPFISKLFHTGPEPSYKKIKKPLCAFIVLKK